jgi:hypothetical protein
VVWLSQKSEHGWTEWRRCRHPTAGGAAAACQESAQKLWKHRSTNAATPGDNLACCELPPLSMINASIIVKPFHCLLTSYAADQTALLFHSCGCCTATTLCTIQAVQGVIKQQKAFLDGCTKQKVVRVVKAHSKATGVKGSSRQHKDTSQGDSKRQHNAVQCSSRQFRQRHTLTAKQCKAVSCCDH